MAGQELAIASDAEAKVAVTASDQSGSSDSDTGKAHQFNEQTNYVPKSTIITVRDRHTQSMPNPIYSQNPRSSWPAPASTCSH
jgi:hypothetical protein